MKVLHVLPSLSPGWGGPVAVVADLARALRQQGVTSTVFAATGRRVGGNHVPIDGTATRLFPTGPLALVWTGHSPTMARALRLAAAHHDLVHIHELWHYPGYAAARAAWKVGRPYMVTVHGGLGPVALGRKALRKSLYMATFQRRILVGAAVLQAFTEAEAGHIRQHVPGAAVAVIPNGVRPEAFDDLPVGADFPGNGGDLSGKRVVLFLGRVHPGKGLDILARAFAQVARQRPDARLVIAGPDEGGYSARVQSILRKGRVLDRASFTGMLTGPHRLAALARADVFVLPSYFEGFSMAVLEALACGLPVVISRQCNFPEVAQAGAGLVIDTDAGQLAQALAQLLDAAPEQRRDMGERGRRLVRERYTWDAIAARMADLYRQVVEAHEQGVDLTPKALSPRVEKGP